MPISFTDQFNIKKDTNEIKNMFNPILDLDTKFFIDPALIQLCLEPEFANAKKKVEDFFSSIILLIKHSKVNNDKYWKAANKRLSFKEINGTCLGYSNRSTDGNAIGPKLRNDILATLKDFVDAGIEAPELFELLGVFQEGIGCDRVSDLITYILSNNILQYTQRIVSNLKIETMAVKNDGQIFKVVKNPYNEKPILLLPKVILSPLPIAKSFEDISSVCIENQRVRDEISKYVDVENFKEIKKADIRTLMIKHKELFDTILSEYEGIPRVAYDFSKSINGEYIWYEQAQEYANKYPLKFDKTIDNINDVKKVAYEICEQFKKLIEKNGLNKLLYVEEKPRSEHYAQLLFLGIADTYCKINDIDLSPETNKGRGPVDFKLSRGYNKKVLVEVKLTSNNQLQHGFDTQLPIYMGQEETEIAIYLIIDNGHQNKMKNFMNKYNELNTSEKQKIRCITIDATIKPSASKA